MANLCTTLESFHNHLLSGSDSDSCDYDDEVVKLRTNTASRVVTRRQRQESSSSDGRSSTDRMFIPKRGCSLRSTSCDSRRHPGKPEYIRCRCCGKLKKAKVSFSDEVEEDIESKTSARVNERTRDKDSSVRTRSSSCERGYKQRLDDQPGLKSTSDPFVSVVSSKRLPTYEEFVRARGQLRTRGQGLPPQARPSDPARVLLQHSRRRCSSPYPQCVQTPPGKVPQQQAIGSLSSTSPSSPPCLPPPLNPPSYRSGEAHNMYSLTPAHVLPCNTRSQVSECLHIQDPALGRSPGCGLKLGKHPCIQTPVPVTKPACNGSVESLPMLKYEVPVHQHWPVGNDDTIRNKHDTELDVKVCSEDGMLRSSRDKFVLDPEIALVSTEVFSHCRSHVSETRGPLHQSCKNTSEKYYIDNTSNTRQTFDHDSVQSQPHQPTYSYGIDQRNANTPIQASTLFSRPPKIPNKRILYTSKRLPKSCKNNFYHTNFANIKRSFIQQGTDSRFGCSESEIHLQQDGDVPPALPPKPRISNHCSSVNQSSLPPPLPPRAVRPMSIDKVDTSEGGLPRDDRPLLLDTVGMADGVPPRDGRPLSLNTVDTSNGAPPRDDRLGTSGDARDSLYYQSKEPERDNQKFILEILV